MLLKRLVLSMAIFMMSSSVCGTVHASNREAEEEAIRKGAEATFKQSGMEENINIFIDKKIPKVYKKLAEQVAPIVKIVINKEVDYKWEF